jgi:hypothetical protein
MAKKFPRNHKLFVFFSFPEKKIRQVAQAAKFCQIFKNKIKALLR